MKFSRLLGVVFSSVAIISVGIVIFSKYYFDKEIINENVMDFAKSHSENYLVAINDATEDVEQQKKIVYDGMTLDELAAKLDRYLASDLKGKGYLYASHSLEIGIDPYLAVAISMHETGCKWGCSTLVKQCNNVGGQKAKPSCNGGSYKYYSTLDEGIIGFMDNIKRNYYDYGLTTPEAMNPKYAADPNWAYVVNKTIDQIKSI